MAELIGVLIALFILFYPPYLIIKKIKDKTDERNYLVEEQRKQDEYYENVKAIREMLEKEQNSNFPKNE